MRSDLRLLFTLDVWEFVAGLRIAYYGSTLTLEDVKKSSISHDLPDTCFDSDAGAAFLALYGS